jgi:hypothetical protein
MRRGAGDMSKCAWCSVGPVSLQCGGCNRGTAYCSTRCQNLDWTQGTHAIDCRDLIGKTSALRPSAATTEQPVRVKPIVTQAELDAAVSSFMPEVQPSDIDTLLSLTERHSRAILTECKWSNQQIDTLFARIDAHVKDTFDLCITSPHKHEQAFERLAAELLPEAANQARIRRLIDAELDTLLEVARTARNLQTPMSLDGSEQEQLETEAFFAAALDQGQQDATNAFIGGKPRPDTKENESLGIAILWAILSGLRSALRLIIPIEPIIEALLRFFRRVRNMSIEDKVGLFFSLICILGTMVGITLLFGRTPAMEAQLALLKIKQDAERVELLSQMSWWAGQGESYLATTDRTTEGINAAVVRWASPETLDKIRQVCGTPGLSDEISGLCARIFAGLSTESAYARGQLSFISETTQRMLSGVHRICYINVITDGIGRLALPAGILASMAILDAIGQFAVSRFRTGYLGASERDVQLEPSPSTVFATVDETINALDGLDPGPRPAKDASAVRVAVARQMITNLCWIPIGLPVSIALNYNLVIRGMSIMHGIILQLQVPALMTLSDSPAAVMATRTVGMALYAYFASGMRHQYTDYNYLKHLFENLADPRTITEYGTRLLTTVHPLSIWKQLIPQVVLNPTTSIEVAKIAGLALAEHIGYLAPIVYDNLLPITLTTVGTVAAGLSVKAYRANVTRVQRERDEAEQRHVLRARTAERHGITLVRGKSRPRERKKE